LAGVLELTPAARGVSLGESSRAPGNGARKGNT